MKILKKNNLINHENHVHSLKKILQKLQKENLKEWAWFLLRLVCLCLAIYITSKLFFCPAMVHGFSMNPTLEERDILLVRRFRYKPDYNDIVICHSGKGYENELIKRVIGLPGDVINIDDNGNIVRNNVILQEDYCLEQNFQKGDANYPLTVPNNQYFVLGDNRNNSTDSRYGEIGTLPRENIDGKAILRIFPFTKITIL